MASIWDMDFNSWSVDYYSKMRRGIVAKVAERGTVVDPSFVWVVGYGSKSEMALRAAEAQVAAEIDPQDVPDYARHSVLRTLVAEAPARPRLIEATSLTDIAAQVSAHSALSGSSIRLLVIEDHGLPGVSFFGSDAITVSTLKRHAPQLSQLAASLAPDAQIVLMQCLVAGSEGGKALGQAISAALGGRGVIIFRDNQQMQNQQIEGPAYLCKPNACVLTTAPAEILPFD